MIQYNTIQYNTIQYNTIQYNTILCNCKPPITRNIDQIVTLIASNKSKRPNSLEAVLLCLCTLNSILVTLLNHYDKLTNLVILSLYR